MKNLGFVAVNSLDPDAMEVHEAAFIMLVTMAGILMDDSHGVCADPQECYEHAAGIVGTLQPMFVRHWNTAISEGMNKDDAFTYCCINLFTAEGEFTKTLRGMMQDTLN